MSRRDPGSGASDLDPLGLSSADTFRRVDRRARRASRRRRVGWFIVTMFVSIVGIATLSAYTAYATKQRAEPPAVAEAHGPSPTTTQAGNDNERTGSSTTSTTRTNPTTTPTKAAKASTRTTVTRTGTTTSRVDAATDYRATIDREQRLGRTLVIGGLAALVFACSALLLVGARRRLW